MDEDKNNRQQDGTSEGQAGSSLLSQGSSKKVLQPSEAFAREVQAQQTQPEVVQPQAAQPTVMVQPNPRPTTVTQPNPQPPQNEAENQTQTPVVHTSTFIAEPSQPEIQKPRRKWFIVFAVVAVLILIILVGFGIYMSSGKKPAASSGPSASVSEKIKSVVPYTEENSKQAMRDYVDAKYKSYDPVFDFSGKVKKVQTDINNPGDSYDEHSTYIVGVDATPGADVEQNKLKIRQFVDMLAKDGWKLQQRISKPTGYRDTTKNITSSSDLTWDKNGYEVFTLPYTTMDPQNVCLVYVLYQIADPSIPRSETTLLYQLTCQHTKK